MTNDLLPGLFWYHEYLTGEHWRRIREGALSRTNKTCQGCGATDKKLEVYPKDLAKIETEGPEDTLVICPDCRAKDARLDWLTATWPEELQPPPTQTATALTDSHRSESAPADVAEPVAKSWRHRQTARELLTTFIIIALVAGVGGIGLTRLLPTQASFSSTPTAFIVAATLPSPDPTVTRVEPTKSSTQVPSKQTIVTAASSPTPSCEAALSVTLGDVGQQRCVTGQVLNTYLDKQTFYVYFSKDSGAFYMLSYSGPTAGVMDHVCILARGRIDRLGTHPVMVVQHFGFCN